MLSNFSSKKNILPICILLLSFLTLGKCEYYKAYKYNEQGIQELGETKPADAKTSFHKSISYSYKSYIPIYNIGNTLMEEDDIPAAHEKFQQAIEANPEFREALYNDGQALYRWGKKELTTETCNVERARVLWEQAVNRFKETANLLNAGNYKKPSLDNAKFIEEEISKLKELKENKCKNQKDKSDDQKDKEDSDSGESEDDQNKQAQNNQLDNQDKPQENKDQKDSKDKDKSGKDRKNSKDKDKSGKDGKDSKAKDKSGKDGKDSKDKDKSGKDGKDSGENLNEKNQIGDNGYLPADDGGTRKPTLTPDEQKRLQKEVERIQKRSGETKNHKRSRHQQEKTNKSQEELEKGLKEALW